MSAPRFPWEEAMTLGLGTLRLAPETFWRMTLPELAAAARALRPEMQGAMARGEFDVLMTRYPDRTSR
ncbi:rcc01693 family protein [Parvibaculum sp.]|uniref:rcc01693 family protein n=1 Tax=Parvibaculum sp. TaxID=2024848 RepID=UPI001B026A9D|nr:rcc01693 family protein [Parvibaculum sp.]MBO6634906.1 phage tail assembly chaperone [Parvibaculum sp.]MBO6678641.1 phage tail assembly chaperone [Parvibaculum sp.]MBO6684271.1 phage tail assembly chaperone [Parvibaculum sp.]MBO6905998.1 phage tail assembly chaperone [Parvibaculum sp.]